MLTIRKAILYRAGELRLEEEMLDPTTLLPHQIMVRTLVTGFSTGTDLGNYEGRSTEVPDAPDYPRGVGYSNVGIVEATGSHVSLFHTGDRVFSIKHHQSRYIADDSEILIPLAPRTDVEEASLAYLTHLGVCALRQCNYDAGEDVVVIGLGVIGLCTVAVAKAMGARVIAVANNARRAELAKNLGAEEVHISGAFDPRQVFDGRGADICVLTANTWKAYKESLEMARYGGRIGVLGFPGRAQPAPDFNPVDMRWLYGKQLTIQGAGHLSRTNCLRSDIRFNVQRDLQFVLDQMAKGRLNLTSIISHRFHFTEMKSAYELAMTHSKELSAAVFQWD